MSRRSDGHVPAFMHVEGVEDGAVRYSLVCQRCGGYEQRLKGDGSDMSMVHCDACGAWLGRLAALNAKAALRARAAGLDVDLERYVRRHHRDAPKC